MTDPTKWHVSGNTINDERGRLICTLPSGRTQNGPVIAAAPDLLEAARRAGMLLSAIVEPDYTATRRLLLEAVCKAEGREVPDEIKCSVCGSAMTHIRTMPSGATIERCDTCRKRLGYDK